jgi:hypothetical protein
MSVQAASEFRRSEAKTKENQGILEAGLGGIAGYLIGK